MTGYVGEQAVVVHVVKVLQLALTALVCRWVVGFVEDLVPAIRERRYHEYQILLVWVVGFRIVDPTDLVDGGEVVVELPEQHSFVGWRRTNPKDHLPLHCREHLFVAYELQHLLVDKLAGLFRQEVAGPHHDFVEGVLALQVDVRCRDDLVLNRQSYLYLIVVLLLVDHVDNPVKRKKF